MRERYLLGATPPSTLLSALDMKAKLARALISSVERCCPLRNARGYRCGEPISVVRLKSSAECNWRTGNETERIELREEENKGLRMIGADGNGLARKVIGTDVGWNVFPTGGRLAFSQVYHLFDIAIQIPYYARAKSP